MEPSAGVIDADWTCGRCGAENESWRGMCRSCPASRPKPPADPRAVTAPTAQPVDGPSRAAMAAAVAAFLFGLGVIGYLVVAGRSPSPSSVAEVQTSTEAESTTSSPSTTPAVPVRPSNGDRASALVLAPSDLPPGWQHHTLSGKVEMNPAACGIDEGNPALVLAVRAQMFTSPDSGGLDVVSAGMVTASPEIANDVLAHEASGDISQCVLDEMKSLAKNIGASVTSATSSPLQIDGGSGSTSTLTVSKDGRTLLLSSRQVVFVNADRLSLLTVTGEADAIPDDLFADLVTATAAKLN